MVSLTNQSNIRSALAALVISCFSTSTFAADTLDITNSFLKSTEPGCNTRVGNYSAQVRDIQQKRDIKASFSITVEADQCIFRSNAVPNHDFGEGSKRPFVTPLRELKLAFTLPVSPSIAEGKTELSQRSYDAIMLNGVVLDILSAGCYRPNGRRVDSNGNVAIGCRSTDKWLVDPLAPSAGFGTDIHNAHTQPDGMYHYHGNPMALFDNEPGPDGSPVIGYAADGFPIYGSYFKDATGKVRKAKSGYALRQGTRPSSASDPGGTYDGMYIDDYEFTNAGDLDECNGMTVDGQYAYYVTDTYPWVLKCFSGTADASFRKRRR